MIVYERCDCQEHMRRAPNLDLGKAVRRRMVHEEGAIVPGSRSAECADIKPMDEEREQKAGR